MNYNAVLCCQAWQFENLHGQSPDPKVSLVSKLSELLNQANRNNWSSRDIEREAQKRGHAITFSTISKYLNGKHGEPTHKVLHALSDTLGVDVNELRGAAGLPAAGESFVLPVEASRLTAEQRNAVLHVVRVMLNDNQQHSASPARDEFDLAARKGDPDITHDQIEEQP